MENLKGLAKIGDLIRVKQCGPAHVKGQEWDCDCFFCRSGSNRVGLVIGPMPNNSYEVAFDAGVMELYDHEFGSGYAEVIRESR